MRTQSRNKQCMWYALPGGNLKKYERDDDGNIIYESYEDAEGNEIFYLDENGEKIPRDTGEIEPSFLMPVAFKGAIFSQLENAIMRAWGADNTNNYAVLVVPKNALPDLRNGTRIWRKSEIKYKEDGTPDETSADYMISGVLDEELNEDSYYLTKLDDGYGEKDD